MKIVMIGSRTGSFCRNNDKLISELRGRCHEVKAIFREPGDRRNLMEEIRGYSPELLMTEDLEGFEMCTLTDAVSYNLLHCRQLHFLMSGKPENEKYLGKQLSLLMTFVCKDPGAAAGYLGKYPDIPEIVSIDMPYEDTTLEEVINCVRRLSPDR